MTGKNKCYDGLIGTVIPEANGIPMDNLSGSFKKAQYREYTDETFTTLKERPASQAHLGILGGCGWIQARSVLITCRQRAAPDMK
jgi:hephaestin